MNIKVVGTFAMKDGAAVVVHGDRVVYEGPIAASFGAAERCANSFILMSIASKKKLDAKIAESQKGKPLAPAKA